MLKQDGQFFLGLDHSPRPRPWSWKSRPPVGAIDWTWSTRTRPGWADANALAGTRAVPARFLALTDKVIE
jgi:hypothetical protein